MSDEIIRLFQLYSEVRDLGCDLLKRHGHSNINNAYARLQAYMRQGIAFYNSARSLQYRASPLLYYYSFLNIAKAIITVTDPLFTGNKEIHGLYHKGDGATLKKHEVSVQSKGVFPRFYKQMMQTPVPSGTKLKIRDLLGYCSDITWEYSSLGFGRPRYVNCLFALTRDVGEPNFRATVAATRRKNPDRQLESILKPQFFEVSIPTDPLSNIFDLTGAEGLSFSFWRSRASLLPNADNTIQADALVSPVIASLGSAVDYCPFDEKPLFRLTVKTTTPGSVPMHEIVAIYTLMFFFGSLVRYSPHILEGMLTKRDAWMVESFVRSTPLTFLRHARNALDGSYLAYRPR